VEPFRPSQHEAEGQLLHDELAAWAAKVSSDAKVIEMVMPDGIADRDADVWMPLLAVAELADGPWPDLAKDTALKFVRAVNEAKSPSLGVQLLADIKACLVEEASLPTKDLLERLLADEEAPWGDMKGRRLDPRGLAKMLRQFGIRSEGLRVGNATPKGYKREAFHDAWKRYLPTPAETATGATNATDAGTS
jgi:hypothetical protein